MLTVRRRLTLNTAFATGLIAVVIVTGCAEKKPALHAGPAHQIKKSEMSLAEQKYGIAPIPDSSVTYQPDVIVVGGGAESVRAQDPNGFIWTIDASAAHADELEPGKVLFMTNRVVGRVLDVRKQGADLVVVIGPVNITEIVRDADIRVADLPINFDEALAYTATDLPGKVVSLAQLTPVPATATPTAFRKTSGSAADEAAGAPVPDVSNLVNFKTVPVVSSAGVGLRGTTDAGGLKVKAEVLVHLAAPKVDVVIKIESGSIVEASVELKGAAGLTWNFEAGTDVGLKANVHGLLTPDTDYSIPISLNGAFPVAITVRQRLSVDTGLGVRNTTIGATGDYSFNGGFKVGYINKTWTVGGPLGFHQNTNLVESGYGVSLAAAGINLAHSMKVIAGVGAFGFVAGPYFTFTSGVGLARTSDIGMLACMRAPIVVKLSGGVGYLIPQSVTSAINFILRKLNIKYQVTGEGGLESGDPITIINRDSNVGGCPTDKKT